ncbi:hypothetical protein [Pseudomonas gingeri]|uniref:phage tail tube protein n=1 Tax=Pseudomonas gingeri TaxID=117681 RepID=UPI0015BD88FC|nr:hypothetical protein [Pseudomonas gingeri]NWD49021.1 hypothetical protein [Pseudomonas gingeri]
MAREIETFVVGGLVKMRQYGVGGPFTPVGLVSTLTQAIEKSDITLADTTQPQGGEYDSLSRITAMTLTMNWRELYTGNMAAMFWADTSRVPAATVTDELHTAMKGGTILLDKMPLTITSVMPGTGAGPAFVEGDDFQMTGAGIEILQNGSIADNAPIKVTYASAAVDVVEALTNSGKIFEFLFEGANAAGTKKRINLQYFRCQLSPAASSNWISADDFMGGEVVAKVLSDPAKVGQGKSKYMKIIKEVTAD